MGVSENSNYETNEVCTQTLEEMSSTKKHSDIGILIRRKERMGEAGDGMPVTSNMRNRKSR